MTVLERAQQFVDRRRLLVGLSAAVVVALIAAAAGLLSGGGDGQSVQATGAAQATTVTSLSGEGVVNADPGVLATQPAPPGPTTSTTAPALVLGTVITRPPTTAAPKPAAKAPAPSTTAALKNTTPPNGSPPTSVCRNSYDSACGPFSWQPPPDPNQPITGQVTANNTTVRVGDTVTFTVTGMDPDAAPLQECNINFGDGQGYHCDPRPAVDPSYCPPQYGPWTPPAKKQGTINTPMDHSYSQPGTYQVTFNVRSAMQECNNPYASSADFQITIVVTP